MKKLIILLALAAFLIPAAPAHALWGQNAPCEITETDGKQIFTCEAGETFSHGQMMGWSDSDSFTNTLRSHHALFSPISSFLGFGIFSVLAWYIFKAAFWVAILAISVYIARKVWDIAGKPPKKPKK